jgi:hypothetical protein
MNPSRTLTASGARVSTSGKHKDRIARQWQAFTIVAVVALGGWYMAVHRHPSANHYHGLVVSLGWIGTALALMTVALSVRKRAAYQGVGRMSAWLTAHIYLGITAVFTIFFHSGFRTGGPLSAWLLAFFSLTVASGLLGWWLSRKVPPLLTALEEAPAIMEDLLTVREENFRGMLELARGGSTDFRTLVEQRLMKETASWTRMWRFYRRRSTLAQELPAFQKEQEEAQGRLRPHEHRAFARAAEYALRVNKMNAELFLQRALRAWLTLHIGTTTVMFGLAAIHIFSQIYY